MSKRAKSSRSTMIRENAKLVAGSFILIAVIVGMCIIIPYRTPNLNPLALLTSDKSEIVIRNNMSPSEDVVLYNHSEDKLIDSSPQFQTRPKSSHEVHVKSESRKTWQASTKQSDTCPKRIAMKNFKRNEIPKELYKVAPDVFDNVPSKFIEGLRSPCWKGANKQMKCFPSFFLAGVGKCGTTDVWAKIVEHPDIVTVTKEPRWWGRRQLGRHNEKRPVPVLKYANHFNKLASQVSQNKKRGKHLITGDGSPSLFWDNALWKKFLTSACSNATTPLYVIPDVIRAVLPRSKILAVFRNPTSRLYSDYTFENKSITREYFHDLVVQSTRLFDSCLVNSSQRDCVFKFFSQYSQKNVFRFGRYPIMKLFKGTYSIFIIDWLIAFPRDQLMFIRLEDWHTHCEEMLPNIYRFLELSPLSGQKITNICSNKQKNKTSGKAKRGPMLNETRTLLDEFYKPTRQDLADILGDDRFLWAD